MGAEILSINAGGEKAFEVRDKYGEQSDGERR